jgi:hypothetical protein
MDKHISNADLKQTAQQFAAGWWQSKTEAEKAWYLRFWASCRR